MNRVTLQDVARKAGVSINTASRAITGKPDVSDDSRAKVLTAASALGYIPNGVARELRRRRTNTIGVVIADIANPFFSAVVKGIEEVTRQAGYHIVLCNSNEDYDREESDVSLLLEKRVDGILICPSQKGRRSIDLLRSRRIPFVLVARWFEDIDTNYVVNDDERGGFIATDYLISKGHERILFLNGPPQVSSARLRYAGYARALTAAGLPIDPGLTPVTDATMEGSYAVMRDVLDRKTQFTAIYAFSDLLAMGAIKALRERGLKVPKDVAVVGHDDIEFVELLETPLTTVDMSKTRLGREAARILLDEIARQDTDAKDSRDARNSKDSHGTTKVVLEPRLVIRASA